MLKPINIYNFVKAKNKNARRGYKFHGDGFTTYESNLHKWLMFYDWNKLDASIWKLKYFTQESSYVREKQYIYRGRLVSVIFKTDKANVIYPLQYPFNYMGYDTKIEMIPCSETKI